MRHLHRTFVVLLLLLPFTPVQAELRQDLDDPSLAASIDGQPLPLGVVDLMQRLAQQAEPGATRRQVVQALIDDRLLATHARAHYREDELVESNKVGFSPAMQLEQFLVSDIEAAFSRELAVAVKQEKGGSLAGVIVAQHRPTAADWDAVLGRQPRLLLEYALDEKGRAAAASIPLLRYRFGRMAAGAVTLLDVYDAQNVQGRNQLHARDADFAMQQARLLLKNRYVLHWAQTRSGLSASDYALFQQAVRDRMARDGWMALIGVSSDMHADPAHLKTLAAAVTPAEIRAYYDAHPEEFRRVDRVRVRHIRLADGKAAEAAYARLQQGADFAALARELSQADDRVRGGDLGWLVHGTQPASWLESLAFVQKAGVVSRPFRSPGAPGQHPAWEILKVEEKVESLQPADSESVRYVASRAIARQKAVQEYRDTLAQVRAQADIRLNPAVLSPAGDRKEVEP